LSYSDQASAYALHQGSLSVQLFRSGTSQAGPLILGLPQYGPVPPTNDCNDTCNEELPDEATGADGNNSPVDAFSDNPVRWSDGTIRSRAHDLSNRRIPPYPANSSWAQKHNWEEKYGKPGNALKTGPLVEKAGFSRSYTNSIAYNPNVYNGPGMVSLQLPYI